jgi:hypothetical protein
MMFATWYFTVSTRHPRICAISGFDSPLRTSNNTDHSTGVRTSGCAGRPRCLDLLWRVPIVTPAS